ncbi:MAG TPA: hypothetical protein VFC46_08900, partial [Humisphaera sp.]|nr:hypothetical protein [Humisphaera sp.]
SEDHPTPVPPQPPPPPTNPPHVPPQPFNWKLFVNGVWNHVRHLYGTKAENILGAIVNAALAMAVGVIGAYTYLYGIWAGFIERASRDSLIIFLQTGKLPARLWHWTRFVICGGLVAAVFQLGQPDTFAPIQAFVLGVTWFAVVSRSASSSQSKDYVADLENRLNKAPDQAPGAAAGRSNKEVEIRR